TMVLGIGLVIVLYARYYLAEGEPIARFYGLLLTFMGAMQGVVLADNLILLVVFWELTGLSSFLLIGFWSQRADARQGARMALAITGGGGLALLAGVVLIGSAVGSYDLDTVLAAGPALHAHPYYLPALVLVLLGAFTKSAQFPFHFWLPQAMAAPTPVSAYLHSATMVKAGLFLMARLWPVLAGTPEWFYIVATTGLITMVLGAVIALFKDDLKALLAFSTVSHLGLITMLLGFGTPFAAVVAVFHIINHATFKAALFMSAGIVDHETHTRDIKRLGGLRHLMPVTFTIVMVAGLSMAGIPLFNGFLSKEMMLDAATEAPWDGNHWIVPALATLGALFSVAYSFRLIVHTFLGPKRDDYPAKPHDPGFGMWAPPALLAVLVVLIGIMPALMVGPLVATASGAVIGGELPYYSLKIWHGVNAALFMSIAAVAGGLVLLAMHRPLDAAWIRARRPEAKAIFDALMGTVTGAAKALTDGLHNGAMTRYASVFTLAVILAGSAAWFGGTAPAPVREVMAIGPVPLIGWILLIVATGCMVAFHRNRLLSLVLMGIVGLIVSVAFAYMSAPDLALTQISVEVVTIILLLLALNFLPKHTPVESSNARRFRDGTIAVLGGLAVGGLTLAMLLSDFSQES
ncbi:MAG TPA: proton-conducting transporter membrane subunit, partial [Paracoccaceae bacterium]|nr:proton-conducting transporter membrane subunit [Paracoccaceae bacterium]